MLDKQPYLKRLKELYQAKTGKVLSDAEALFLFENLITLVAAVYQPIAKNHE